MTLMHAPVLSLGIALFIVVLQYYLASFEITFGRDCILDSSLKEISDFWLGFQPPNLLP